MRHTSRKLPPLVALIGPLYPRLQLLDAAIGGVVALLTAAMLFYPGGTWWDPTTAGHRFWENFLCDLLHKNALNGVSNLVSARFAQLGMVLLVLAVAGAFSLGPELVPSRRPLGKRLAKLGMASSLLLLLAPLLPSDRFPALHAQSTVFATLPALLIFAVLVGTILLEPVVPPLLRGTTLLLLVILVGCLVLYARQRYFGGAKLKLLPGLERVATLLLLAWLMSVSRFVRRRLFDALEVAQAAKRRQS